jgi:hypothetical protein
MSVTEVLTALGSWQVELLPTCPKDILDALVEFGHVAIVPGRVDVRTAGDNLLTAARYVGVVRSTARADDGRTKAPGDKVTVGGAGMAFWLGDEDDKGAVIENATTFATASFATAITGLLPASGAVTVGTLYPVAGTYTGKHQWQTPRKAIGYVCDTFSTTTPTSWRVNGNGTLDAGPVGNLFVVNPVCAIVKRGAGQDMSLIALPGQINLTRDVEDFSTRVVLIAEGNGISAATGSANLGPGQNPYKDIHGNQLAVTRMVSESGTSQINANIRAAVALADYITPHTALTMTTADYDIDGSFSPGDYVYAYDPDKGIYDPVREVTFRGQRINPMSLQVTETTWPITTGYTIAYRAGNGTWTDVTDYVKFEDTGTTSVTVGAFDRQFANSGAEPIGSRPTSDSTIPGTPTLVTPFTGSAYLDGKGFTRSRVIVNWTAPNNSDGSSILDGDHYEIRYAVDTDLIYPATWAQLSQVRWMDLQQWRQPFAAPTGQWLTVYVGWGSTTVQLQDLSPGIGYDVQIRAVDKAGNAGPWSATTTFVATADNIPPSTPAPPAVAGSRIALQITHTLGKATGGTFNLESDLHHLEIHVEYEPYFTPSTSTLKGKVSATAGMIQAKIPVVATVQVEETTARYVRVVAVDIAGNKSAPSDAASATAQLIDDAHISDLTVSKVTAGTINADWVVGARIKTADTGARVELNSAGLQTYDASGTQTVDIAAADGSVSIIGQLRSGTAGRRIEINPTATLLPEIRFYASSGTNYGYLNGLSFSGTDLALGLNSGSFTAGGNSMFQRLYMTDNNIQLAQIKASDQTTLGGYVNLNNSVSSIGCTDGVINPFISVASNERLTMRGKWNNYVTADSRDAIFTGFQDVSGFANFSFGYGPTMASTMAPVATLTDTGTLKTCQVTGTNSTGFTLSFSSATSAGSSAAFWVFRV